MDINQAKDNVIKAGKELVAQGLIARTWGNVSQRLDENTMLITPSGKDYLSLTHDDIVKVTIKSLEYDGNVKPSSEKGAHANCYLAKDCGFVIHTHQLYASAVSACEIDSFPIDSSKYPLLGSEVKVAAYGLPSTKKLSQGIADALKDSDGNGIIMKHHGALCFGNDFEETFEAANQLEAACKEYIENKFIDKSGENSFTKDSYIHHTLHDYCTKTSDFSDLSFNLNLDKNIILNNTPEVLAMSYLKKPLRPLVDDFAQIVGVKMISVDYDIEQIKNALKKSDAVFVKGYGAVCADPDAEAVSMIVEKNCAAFLAAALHGKVKYISPLESRLMRTIYKTKYSKQKDN